MGYKIFYIASIIFILMIWFFPKTEKMEELTTTSTEYPMIDSTATSRGDPKKTTDTVKLEPEKIIYIKEEKSTSLLGLSNEVVTLLVGLSNLIIVVIQLRKKK